MFQVHIFIANIQIIQVLLSFEKISKYGRKTVKAALFCISIGPDYGYFYTCSKNMQSWKYLILAHNAGLVISDKAGHLLHSMRLLFITRHVYIKWIIEQSIL